LAFPVAPEDWFRVGPTWIGSFSYWTKVQYPSCQILARKIAAPLEIGKMSPFLQQTVDRKGAVI
jgi:hypothetical protein